MASDLDQSGCAVATIVLSAGGEFVEVGASDATGIFRLAAEALQPSPLISGASNNLLLAASNDRAAFQLDGRPATA